MISKITESEFVILTAMWDYAAPATFTEIRERVQKKTVWDQSTIKTLLQRLCKKGIVSREKMDVYYYLPLVQEAEYQDHIMQSLIDKLYNGSTKNLLAALVNNNTMSKDDIEELRTLLNEED